MREARGNNTAGYNVVAVFDVPAAAAAAVLVAISVVLLFWRCCGGMPCFPVGLGSERHCSRSFCCRFHAVVATVVGLVIGSVVIYMPLMLV